MDERQEWSDFRMLVWEISKVHGPAEATLEPRARLNDNFVSGTWFVGGHGCGISLIREGRFGGWVFRGWALNKPEGVQRFELRSNAITLDLMKVFATSLDLLP